jgi:hypothetical protein
MKKNLCYLAIGLGIILIFSFLIQRSCRVSDRLSELKGQYQAYQEAARKEKEALEAEVKLKEAEIRRHIKRVGEVEADRVAGLEKIEAGNEEIESLEKKLAGLTDKDEIIQTQGKLILTLKYELQLEREDKAKVLEQRDLWKTSYEREHELRLSFEAQLSREEGLRKTVEAMNAQYEKRIQGLQFGSNIKTLLITGLSIYGGYELFIRRK